MAFTRVWSGNVDGDIADPMNWRPVSLRSSKYKWTVTGTAGEYYLELAGGGDPGIPDPYTLQLNGTTVVAGAAGSLAAGEWDYGASGAGFNTVIYRTSGTADPDTVLARDSLQAYWLPQDGDSVIVPASGGDIDENLDFSAVDLVDWIVEEGYSGDVGSETGYLHLSLSGRLSWNATGGTAYVNLGASAVSPEILSTGTGQATGGRGLYLLGTAIATLDVHGGSVAVAALPGETSTVTTLRVTGSQASAWAGPGVTLTTWYQQGGTDCRLRCAATTVRVWDGLLTTDDVGAYTTVQIYGGTFRSNSTGTITSLTMDEGVADFRGSGLSRTVTTLTLNGGTLLVDRTIVTITTLTLPTGPISVAVE